MSVPYEEMSGKKGVDEANVLRKKALEAHKAKALGVITHKPTTNLPNMYQLPYESALYHPDIKNLAQLNLKFRDIYPKLDEHNNFASVGLYDDRQPSPLLAMRSAMSGGSRETSAHSERRALLYALQGAARNHYKAGQNLAFPTGPNPGLDNATDFRQNNDLANFIDNIPVIKAFTERKPCTTPQMGGAIQNCDEFLGNVMPQGVGRDRSVYYAIPFNTGTEMNRLLAEQLKSARTAMRHPTEILGQNPIVNYAPPSQIINPNNNT